MKMAYRAMSKSSVVFLMNGNRIKLTQDKIYDCEEIRFGVFRMQDDYGESFCMKEQDFYNMFWAKAAA